jgi:hypothetical protein
MTLALLLFGLLVFLAGGLMLLVAAFRVSIWWGIFSILFTPVLLLFVILNWSKAKTAMLVQVIGVVVMIAAIVMMGDLLKSLRDHPVASFKQFSWSNTPARPDIIHPQAGDIVPILPEQRNFNCDGRTRCGQMTSCDEAKYFIEHCPNTEMDGDRDGVPCESQWCTAINNT